MAGFKKQEAKKPEVKKVNEEEKVKPCSYMKCAAKGDDGKWEEVLVTGLFIDAGIPSEKLPDGTVQLRGKTLNEFTIPAGAIVKVTLHKAFAEMGIKAVVNNDGEISIEAAE